MALVEVRATFSGVFYSSPEPEKPPFVKEGATVSEGLQLGIIERMKFMNAVYWGSKIASFATLTWKNCGLPLEVDKIGKGIVRSVVGNETLLNVGDLIFEIEVEGEEPEGARQVALESSPREQIAESSEEKKLVEVRSQWVGWYFLARFYSTKPYVQVGDLVKKGTTLCRIKTLTESRIRKVIGSKRLVWKNRVIKAPVKSIIRERFEPLVEKSSFIVREKSPVEYDQLLFTIEPTD